MAKKYLDDNGLLYLWGKIKATFMTDISYNSTTNYITKTKNGSTSNVVQLPSGVSPSSTTPKMDGTAATGSETAFARGDHVHPSDTTKVDKVNGKGLSTNDYTTAEQTKLAGIAEGATVDDHKWNDVELSHTDFANTIGVNSDYRGYIPVIGGVTSGDPSINSTSSKMLKLSTFATDGNSVAGRDKDGYLWSKTPTSGDSSTRVATTAFVGSAISGKVDSSSVGAASGICPLDSSGKVDSSYLPSYVDDVIEAYPRSGQTELSQNWLSLTSGGSALTPESGKIYVLMAASTNYDINTQFRWGGTAYVKLADGGVTAITNAEIDTIVAS